MEYSQSLGSQIARHAHDNRVQNERGSRANGSRGARERTPIGLEAYTEQQVRLIRKQIKPMPSSRSWDRLWKKVQGLDTTSVCELVSSCGLSTRRRYVRESKGRCFRAFIPRLLTPCHPFAQCLVKHHSRGAINANDAFLRR